MSRTTAQFLTHSLLMAALVAACQSQEQLPSAAPALPVKTMLQQSQTSFSPSARLEQTAPGRLHFSVHYPRQSASKFQTQALQYADFARFQIKVIGIGISAPLYGAHESDPPLEGNHFTIPAACTASACQVQSEIQNVPSGQNRVALITPYDAAGAIIPGATLAAVFEIPPDLNGTHTIHLSYLSTPAGLVMAQLLAENQQLLVSELEAQALQDFIEELTSPDGGSPEHYQQHPSLINVAALVEALKQSKGDFTALKQNPAAYLHQGGTLKGTVTGLKAGESVTLQLSDPRTEQLVLVHNTGSEAFNFSQIPPGEWRLQVTAPTGYTVSGVPAVISISEGQSWDLPDPILLVSAHAPQVTYLSTGAALAGESILINGIGFSEVADENSVLIGSQPIDAADVTVLSSSQLQVKIPTGLTGPQTISVQVKDELAQGTPTLEIVSKPAWSDNDTYTPTWQTLPATENENVLAISASTHQPDIVWFGAQGNTGTGGIWRCDSAANSDNCSNILSAAHVGAIQTLIQSPDNPDLLYAGSATQGVYVCESDCQDAGNWQQRNTGLTNLNVRALVADPQEPSHVYAATADGVYFSDNQGLSWSDWSAGLTTSSQKDSHALAIYRPNLLSQAILFVGTDGAGVHRKKGPEDWASINRGIFSDNADSEDGEEYLKEVAVSALRPHPNNPDLLYGGGTGKYTFLLPTWKVGIWQRIETGPNRGWKQIGRNGENGFPCPLYSSLGGCNPQTMTTGLKSMQIQDIAVDPVNPEHVYAAAKLDTDFFLEQQPGGIYRSTSAAKRESGAADAWQLFSPSFSNANVLAINSLRLYAGTPSGLYRVN